MSEYIWVVPGDNRKVGLIDEDPVHPGGIARVVGDATNPENVRPVRVARTWRVNDALARKSIVQVDAPPVEEKAKRGRKPADSAPEPTVEAKDEE